jgi:hypothetical protein
VFFNRLLTSHAPEAASLSDLIRRHWGIENRCDWILDITFDKDHCRVRKSHTEGTSRCCATHPQSPLPRSNHKHMHPRRNMRENPENAPETQHSKMW